MPEVSCEKLGRNQVLVRPRAKAWRIMQQLPSGSLFDRTKKATPLASWRFLEWTKSSKTLELAARRGNHDGPDPARTASLFVEHSLRR